MLKEQESPVRPTGVDISKEKSTAFLKKLNQAREAYEFLETTCGMKFDKSTDASFIPVWEKVFAS